MAFYVTLSPRDGRSCSNSTRIRETTGGLASQSLQRVHRFLQFADNVAWSFCASWEENVNPFYELVITGFKRPVSHTGSPRDDQTLPSVNVHFKPLLIRKPLSRVKLPNESINNVKQKTHVETSNTNFWRVNPYNIVVEVRTCCYCWLLPRSDLSIIHTQYKTKATYRNTKHKFLKLAPLILSLRLGHAAIVDHSVYLLIIHAQ